MIASLFSGQQANLLHTALDASSLQHKVIADNIANVDTPGFKRSSVDFKERLREAVHLREQASLSLKGAITDSNHMEFAPAPDIFSVKPLLTQDQSSSFRNDGNNVDIDREMTYLTQNTLLYNTLAQFVNTQFSDLRFSISEGKR